MRSGFVRRGDRVEVGRDGTEQRLVAIALRILEDTDPDDRDDPGAVRLSYSAHPDDEAADGRFRELTGEMLADARRRDRSTCEATLAQDGLALEEAEAWMRVVGEARLVLGARIGIDADGWEDRVDPDRASPDMILLHLLGRVQDELVAALGGPD